MAVFFLFLTTVNAYEFPPYEGLSLKIEGQLAETYSNNITFASENEDRIEDLMTVLDLGIGMKYEGTRRIMGINGRLNRQMRTNSGRIENSSERVFLDFSNEFSKYDRINFNGSYAHTQVPGLLDEGLSTSECQELEDRFGRDQVRQIYPECDKFEEEFGRFAGKFDSYNSRASLNYRRDLGEQFNLNIVYSYRNYWSPEEGTTDSYGNSVRLGVNYGYSALTMFSVSYYFDEGRYNEGDVISSQSVAIGIRRYITKLLYLNARIGQVFSSSSDNIEIETSVTGQLDEKTTSSILFFKGDEISSDREDLFRSWRITGNVTRYLLEDLRSIIAGFYGQGKFVSVGITDTLIGGSISLDYSFWKDKSGRNLSGNIGYTYSDIESTDENRSYSRSGVTLGITAGF